MEAVKPAKVGYPLAEDQARQGAAYTHLLWQAEGCAFVEYMVDELITETTAWGDFKFHDSGEGVTGALIGDVDMESTDNESRVVGSQIEGATGEIYKSVGEITYSGALAITEHGLFNIVTGGILLDRHVFGAINVVNTDSIEFSYEYTIDDGG